MKSPSTNPEAGICLPGEQSWELWKHSSGGWQIAQTAPAGPEGGPAFFKTAGVFGYPVSAAFAVPVRAATGDADMLPDIIEFQLEKQGLKPETPVGNLLDWRTVEREESRTLVLASVLNSQMADDLPREAPQRFEISPYLFYLPDNHLVIWKELGRLVFCVTRGDQPIYYHALSTQALSADNAPEIEQLLMPLYTQGIITGLDGIVLWTDSVEPGAAEELSRTFGAKVRSEPRPKPTLPQERSSIEPVSVAMEKIRAAKMRRLRNIVIGCLVGYLAVPAFFAIRYYLASQDLATLKRKVSTMQVQFGNVAATLAQAKVMDVAVNPEKYPIELLYQVLRPLYQPNSFLRLLSIEIERKVPDVGPQTASIAIKGESNSNNTQAATLYGTRIKNNPLLKEFTWDPAKVDAAKADALGSLVVPFQINGTLKPTEDAPIE